MGKESIADQIARSLSFEIQAVPQEDLLKQDSGSTNKQQVNVKIKVRKKNQAPIQDGILTIPPGNRQVRLISSDQTIMSFDLMMEHNKHMGSIKKSRKGIFGMIGSGGCLGTEGDDDDYAYLPVPCAGSLKDISSNDGLKKDYTLSKSALDTAEIKPKHFFGKCKPGGCLDPPYSEDRYSYKPTIIPLNASEPRPSRVKDDKNIDKRSSMFHGKLFKHKGKSIDIEKGDSEDETDSNAVLSLFRTGSRRNSISIRDSNSIITYPIGLTTPRSTLEDNKLKRASDNKSRKSINEVSDVYFIKPKQLSETLNRLAPKQSNRTDSLTDDQSVSIAELASLANIEGQKIKDQKIFDVELSDEKFNFVHPVKEPSDSQGNMGPTYITQVENETELLQNDLKKYSNEENSQSTANITPNITNHFNQNITSDFVESLESNVDHTKEAQMNEMFNNGLLQASTKTNAKLEIISATTAGVAVATAIASAILEENQVKQIFKTSNNLLLDDQDPQINKSNFLNQDKQREIEKVNPMADKSDLSCSKLMPESGDESNDQDLKMNESNYLRKINKDEQREPDSTADKSEKLMPESGGVILNQNKLLTPSVNSQRNILNTTLVKIEDSAKPEENNILSNANNVPTDKEKMVVPNINQSKGDLIENEISVVPISSICNHQMTRLDTDISKNTEKITEGKESNNFDDIEFENQNETSNFIDIQRKVDKHVENNQELDNKISAEVYQNNQDHRVKLKEPSKYKHTLEIQDVLIDISRISKEPSSKQDGSDTGLDEALLKPGKKDVAPDNFALIKTIDPKSSNFKSATEGTSNDRKKDYSDISDDVNATSNSSDRNCSLNDKLASSDSIRDSSQIPDDSNAKIVNFDTNNLIKTSFEVINIDETSLAPEQRDEHFDNRRYQSDSNLAPQKRVNRLPSIEIPSHMNSKFLNLTNILATNNVAKQRDETSDMNSHELIKIPSNDTLTHHLKQSEERAEATLDLNENFKPMSSVNNTSRIPESRATYTQYEITDKTETQNEFQNNNYPDIKINNKSRKSSSRVDKLKAPIDQAPITKEPIDKAPKFQSSIDSIIQKSGVLENQGGSLQREPTVEGNTTLGKLSTTKLSTEYAENKQVEIVPPIFSIKSFISSPKSDVVTVDLGLQSYVNENNERVLKTFDTQNEPAPSPKTTLAIIKSKMTQFDENIRIPIDIDHDISIQIKTSKIPTKDKLSFGGRTKIAKTVTNKIPDDKASDPKFHDILSSLYEEELLPLQKILKNLKSEIDVLALNKDILRDKLYRIDKSKFTSPSKRCGCLKIHPF